MLLVLLLFWTTVDAKQPEKYYQEMSCRLVGGTTESMNSDGTRTDCYTELVSIEYDFAHKWYECLTQAMYYAMLNNNAPVCFLILEKESDSRYVDRAQSVIRRYNIPVVVKRIDAFLY